MSFFQKCEVYLNKYNIELDDNDYTPDGRILVDSNDEIRKWDFPNIPKPSADDLNKIDDKDIEKSRKKKQKKQKLKRIKSFEFPILDDEDLLNIVPYDGMIYIHKKDENLYYYLNGKLKKVRVFDGV
jgi:hypothetical protein